MGIQKAKREHAKDVILFHGVASAMSDKLRRVAAIKFTRFGKREGESERE